MNEPTEMTEREKLEEALRNAKSQKRALDGEVDSKIKEARIAINVVYAERVDAAIAAVQAANQALQDHIEANASHPWDGKRVFRMGRNPGSWFSSPTVRQDGIVEVVRRSSQFPSNTASYSRPSVGDVIVRKVKKNGEPSLQFWDYFKHSKWQLAE